MFRFLKLQWKQSNLITNSQKLKCVIDLQKEASPTSSLASTTDSTTG